MSGGRASTEVYLLVNLFSKLFLNLILQWIAFIFGTDETLVMSTQNIYFHGKTRKQYYVDTRFYLALCYYHKLSKQYYMSSMFVNISLRKFICFGTNKYFDLV